MFEVQMLVPVDDNDGKTFAPAHHAAFEVFVLERFGGVTLLPRRASGAWLQDGTRFTDRTRVYVIAIGSIVDGGKVGEVAEFAKSHYRQFAIYVRYLGLAEVL